MTCIVGFENNGKVTIAGDSCASNGHTGGPLNYQKVFKNGDFIIGGTTSFRLLDILRYTFKPPEQKASESDDVYMRTSFIESFRNCVKNSGIVTTVNGDE